jgi:heptosyltransferase I
VSTAAEILHSKNDPAAKAIQRLLIVRLGSMGDVIHALPAAWALRSALPEATLGWIVEERWAELLCASSEPRHGPCSARRPLVDNVHVVNTKTWRKHAFSMQTWERVAASISDLRAGRYEVAIDFQGAVRSAFLARCSGAPTIYGFRQPRESVASMLYTRQVLARGSHVVQQNLSLAEEVVSKFPAHRTVQFPCDEAAEKKCEAWLQNEAVHDFVLVNPGAGWGSKQWPAERYGQVARLLAKDGLQSVVNFGPGEKNLAEAVVASSQGFAKAASLSLAELVSLTRRAKLFIGGDTGPMHLAAALSVPVVGLFGPTNPVRNGPFGTKNIVLRHDSSKTSLSHRTAPDPGLQEITAGEVVAAARRLLRQSCG